MDNTVMDLSARLATARQSPVIAAIYLSDLVFLRWPLWVDAVEKVGDRH
jgi:hypothetical protein